jgi:hypothetical protein
MIDPIVRWCAMMSLRAGQCGAAADEDAAAADRAARSRPQYPRIAGVPPEFARQADRSVFHVLVATPAAQPWRVARGVDFGNDCGICNAATLEQGAALRAWHGHPRHTRLIAWSPAATA